MELNAALLYCSTKIKPRWGYANLPNKDIAPEELHFGNEDRRLNGTSPIGAAF